MTMTTCTITNATSSDASDIAVMDAAESFLASADSRETDAEVMQAILKVAGGNATEAVRVWEDPTNPEMIAVWEIVTANGLRPATDYAWGASGTQWAEC
jgi:hypothetical protein